MREIAAGIHHWTAVHPNIGMEVSSYYVEPAALLIDPMATDEAVEALRGLEQPPQRIVLTNRHHYRGSDRLREELGCPVLCPEPGLHEFEGGPQVDPYRFGEEVCPGVEAIEIDAICPDEAALHIDVGDGALAVADGVVNYGGLRFVPDAFMGDDPDAVKSALRSAYSAVLDRDFDVLLTAHGEPIASGAKQRLREFAASASG